jgi:hypothetical protein
MCHPLADKEMAEAPNVELGAELFEIFRAIVTSAVDKLRAQTARCPRPKEIERRYALEASVRANESSGRDAE